MADRTFHSRVGGWYWAVIGVTSGLLLYFFWVHAVVCAVALALVLILEIEMLVHTCYVVTGKGVLRIESGRFSRSGRIEVESIMSARRVRKVAFFVPALSFHMLELTYRGGGKTVKVYVSPQNAEAFVKCLQKHNPSVEVIG